MFITRARWSIQCHREPHRKLSDVRAQLHQIIQYAGIFYGQYVERAIPGFDQLNRRSVKERAFGLGRFCGRLTCTRFLQTRRARGPVRFIIILVVVGCAGAAIGSSIVVGRRAAVVIAVIATSRFHHGRTGAAEEIHVQIDPARTAAAVVVVHFEQ